MPSIRLGLEGAPDFLSKARRELARYQITDNLVDRADHALNLAITIHHLADWTFYHGKGLGLDLGKESDFLCQARNANQSVNLLRKVADTAKHHTLRYPNVLKIEVDDVSYGRLTVNQDFLGIEVQSPVTSVPGGKLQRVRTMIDDDEIVGYQSIFEGTTLTNEGMGQFFDAICEDAIAFWDGVIRGLNKGCTPSWLGGANR